MRKASRNGAAIYYPHNFCGFPEQSAETELVNKDDKQTTQMIMKIYGKICKLMVKYANVLMIKYTNF